MTTNPNPAPEPFPIWIVWREDQPAYGYFATEDAAKHATIDCWEEDEPVCPDYSWRPDGGPGNWELLVGDERAGVYVRRHLVYGGAPVSSAVSVVPPATNQAALRDRIADAIRDAACPGECGKTEEECAKERIQPFAWHHGRVAVVEGEPEMFADAVLGVLPAPVDRAAVLAEAATRYEEILANADTGQDPRYWTAVRDITLGLRAMAAEAPHAETPDALPSDGTHPCGHDDYHDSHEWADRPGVWCPGIGYDEEPAVVAQPGKETAEARACDGCSHPEHPAHDCPDTLYGVRCACDEPTAAGVRQDGAQQ